MDQQVIGMGMLAGVAAAIIANRRRVRGSGKDLDRVLYRWTRPDRFTVRDLLNGGLLIFGITGAGKSSSSGKQIARALVRDRNTWGLILAAKPEELSQWQRIFAESRQSKRLLVIDAEQSPLRKLSGIPNPVILRSPNQRRTVACRPDRSFRSASSRHTSSGSHPPPQIPAGPRSRTSPPPGRTTAPGSSRAPHRRPIRGR